MNDKYTTAISIFECILLQQFLSKVAIDIATHVMLSIVAYSTYQSEICYSYQ